VLHYLHIAEFFFRVNWRKLRAKHTVWAQSWSNIS
jgi:hypothetical protein